MKDANASLIFPEQSLLLVIDFQVKFMPYLNRAQRTMYASQLLLEAAHALKIPVVVTEHNPERIGPTVPEIAKHLYYAPVLRKDVFSCLGDESVLSEIRRHEQVKNILLVGCETHICVLQTTLDALDMGYSVYVAADGVSSRMELDWRLGLERIGKAGGVVATSEMLAYELLRRSDTPEFKAMLPFFKDWVLRATQQ